MLTVDIGNTRVKWGIWKSDAMISSGAFAHATKFSGQLFARCMPDITSIEKIIVANVAGQQAEQALKNWLIKKTDIEPMFLKTKPQCCGVINAYVKAEDHGIDRWAALIAAKSLTHSAVCVISLGTAVTVDLMNADGLHQGGLIMPGLHMMQKALLEDTAAIVFDETDTEQATAAFAMNTKDAVKNGTFFMLRAALEEVCLQATKFYGEDLKIILTGGMAEKILPLLRYKKLIHEPNLVLTGLHIAAKN